MNPSELVVISTFRSVTDAQVAKGLLDQVGIHSMIRADTIGGMYPAVGLAGAELVVRAEDAERAAETLQFEEGQSGA